MSDTPYRHLTANADRGVLVLTLTQPELRGEDMCAAVQEELCAAAAAAGESPRVAVDFRNVTFLTSLGISALLGFRRRLLPVGGRLLLCGLSPAVAEVLFATRLATADPSGVVPLAVAADVETAVAQLAPAAG
jgi:anti-anti-sigma factor